MHCFRLIAAVAAAALFPTLALAGQAATTRIETRPFYGATVTLEEGVRVIRPLPTHERVIINPGGKTPLNLEFETRNITHHHQHTTAPAAGAAPTVAGDPVFVPQGRRHHHHPHQGAIRR